MIENRQALGNIVTLARSLVSVNKMNSANLLKLEATLSQLDSEIMEIEAMSAKAESAMQNLTKVKPQEMTFDKNFPPPVRIAKDTKVEKSSGHPIIKNALAMLGRARANKIHEEAKYFPSINVSAEYMLRQPITGIPMSGDDMISLRVTAPLPLFFAIKESKSVAAAAEGVKQAEQNLEQARRQLETSREGEREMALKYREMYARYHSDVLPRFFASYKAMLGMLGSGQIELLEVIDAYREYLEAAIKEAETLRDLQKSLAMLEYLEAGKE